MSADVGDVLTLRLDRPAHGGTCVGRADGQVVFARHGLPGESVRVEVTALGKGGRFVWADVVEVLEPSPDRREPVCALARPGGCGGCDWQHADIGLQRRMKADVVREQLVRLGHLDPEHPLLHDLVVEPCGDDADGLRYRTRMDFVGDPRGRLGLRSSRSHDVVPVRDCPIAVDSIMADEAMRQPWAPGGLVRMAASQGGITVLPDGATAPVLRERVGDVFFDVAADGFWQVHRNAPATFTAIAAELLQPRTGDFLLDLYGGVGLFARTLGARLGAGGRVVLVESDGVAARLARRNLRSLPHAEVVRERTDRWLAARTVSRADLVVLDPPRAGAGRAVLEAVARLRPRALLYVACDPASLGRDVAYARDAGLRLDALRAVDAFPQTHHVETFARFIAD